MTDSDRPASDDAPSGGHESDAETVESVDPGSYSGRVAVVVAFAGAAAIVVERADPVLGLVLVASLVTVVALGSVDADALAPAVAVRTIGAVGLFVAGAGVLVAGGLYADGSVNALVLGVLLWSVVIATACARVGPSAVSSLRSLVWSMGTAGSALLVAALFGVGSLLAGTTPGAQPLRTLSWWLVAGGQPERAVPIVLALVGVFCGAVATALVLTPRHVLLPPRPTGVAVQRFHTTIEWLTRAAVAFLLVSGVVYLLGIGVTAVGWLATVERVFRTLLVLGIALGSIGAVAGWALGRWFTYSDRSPRSVVATLAAGSVVAVLVTLVVAAVSRTGDTDPSVLLASLGTAAILSILLFEGVALLGFFSDARRRLTTFLPVAGFAFAAILAARAGGVVGPVLAIGASLVVWDALTLQADLQTDVPGADSVAVEQRHLGTVTGFVGAGVVLSVVAYALVALVGDRLGGEPLVVVVAGVLALLVVTVAAGRRRPI